MNPLIILAGPTASGKSETAVALAEHLDSEIISADSMQVYKYFDVGTAKPSKELRDRVPHHLIDILEPDETFTAFDFKTRSLDHLQDMEGRGKTAVMVGGTGLYLKTLMEDRDCAVSVSDITRNALREEIRQKGSEILFRELQQVDPEYAQTINPSDSARIERALSVYRETGKTFSSFHRTDESSGLPFDTHLFLLERERPKLYEKINDRVNDMMDQGLKEEVQFLLDKGYDSQLKPFQSIGYKQMVSHLQGKMDLDQTIHEIQKVTRHYAKRQITWFKKMRGAQSVPVHENDSPQSLKDKIVSLLSQGVALVLVTLLGMLVPKPVVAGEADPFPSALRLIQKGEWDAARSALEGLQRSKLNSKQRHRVEFLLARVWIQNNQHQQAADLLQSLLKPYEIMEDYILLELARAQTALGQYPQALQSLQKLNALEPSSLLKPIAGLLQADLHSLTNEPEKALAALQSTEQLINKRFPQPKYREQIPEILHQQIKIQETLHDFKGSYASYRRLYTRYPEHENAQDAEAQMQRLTEKEGVPAQPLTKRERLRRVRRLLAKTRFEKVIEEVEVMRKQSGILPAKYYFYLADAYQGLRKRPAANRILTEFLNKHASHPRAAKARFTIARNLWNLGNPRGAAKGFQKTIQMSRKPRLTAEAQYLLGAVYEDLKQEKDALREYESLFTKSPDAEFAEKGAWRIGWAHYRAQRWQQAKNWFEKSIQRFPNGNLVEKNHFWLAKTLEKSNQQQKALQEFQNLYAKFPFTYHGLQAGKRLKEKTRNTLAQDKDEGKVFKTEFIQAEEPPQNPGRPLTHQEHYHFNRGIELMGIGMYPEAQAELLRLNGTIRKTYTGVLWLSTWLNRAHAYADSLQLMHLFRRYKTKAREKELPSAFWRNFYPPAYFAHVRAWSNRHQVDPWFATSLMRQESLYNTWALSPAGARGLMQLMPKTARKMVRQNGDPGAFEPDVLFDPETNIQLGIQYLSGLARKYQGNRAHILIAYNAGPKVLKAWKRRFKSINDPDVFVESLPYPETRNYVKRVIRNHEIYKKLYGEEEKPPTKDKTF